MMKRLAALFALLMIGISGAMAMSQSQVPNKFPIPWGNSASSNFIRSIPQNSQIGIQNCAASLTDGFPPLTFTPSSAGGCPPFGQDFNGILKQITQWSQWESAGGPHYYDGTFSSAIGGYPAGTLLQSAIVPGNFWLSTADNNTTNPDAGGAGWVQAPGQVPTGFPMQWLSSTVPTGYVAANGLTIGNASSSATGRANADTQFLFAFLWANCASCTVSGGKGSTAAADYAANKTITTPPMQGLSLMGVDTMGGPTTTYLSGVPISSGSTTVPGSGAGENLHQLVTSELPTVTPTFSGTPHTWSTNQTDVITYGGTFQGGVPGGQTANGVSFLGGPTQSALTTTITPAGTIASFGSNGSHNIVERSILVYWLLKL
jgi:hypothetical protein